jgi:hypothetical protein
MERDLRHDAARRALVMLGKVVLLLLAGVFILLILYLSSRHFPVPIKPPMAPFTPHA